MAPSTSNDQRERIRDYVLAKLAFSKTGGDAFQEHFDQTGDPVRAIDLAKVASAANNEYSEHEFDELLAGLVLDFYPFTLGSPATPDAIDSMKRQLFEREPSTVIFSLIRASHGPLPEDVKTEVLQTLKRSIDHHIALDSQSLYSILEKRQRRAVEQWIDTLRRLQQVVLTGDELLLLLEAGFSSGTMITYTALDQFLDIMQACQMDPHTARRIHNAASTQQSHREIASTLLRQTPHDNLAPITTASSHSVNVAAHMADAMRLAVASTAASTRLFAAANTATVTTAAVGDNKKIVELNLDVLFEDMDMPDVDDSFSVLSPSAYLVDMLRFLKYSIVPAPDVATSQPSPAKLITSVLGYLSRRRPDITGLLLSRANTTDMIPYIDLANEAMASVVSNLATRKDDEYPIIDSVNAENHADDLIMSMQAISDSQKAFENHVHSQLGPLSDFPFNQGLRSLQSLLLTLRTSRAHLMTCLTSVTSIARKIQLGESAYALDIVIDRAMTAEKLGLQHETYVAMTDESWWSKDLYDASPTRDPNASSYSSAIHADSAVAAHWGYSGSEATAAMLDTKKGLGLTFVKDQLLPRSGLKFTELVALISNSYFGTKLFLTSRPDAAPTDAGEFSGKLKDIRLCNGSSSPLDETDCRSLMKLIRFWRATGWDLQTMSMLRITKITTGLLDEVVAVNELSKLAKVSVRTVLNLMAGIPDQALVGDGMHLITESWQKLGLAQGNNSPLDSSTLARLAAILGVSISDCTLAIATLGMPPAQGLDVQGFQRLYRWNIWCRMLRVPLGSLGKLAQVFDYWLDVMASFTEVLKYWHRFKTMESCKITLDAASAVLDMPAESPQTDADISLALRLSEILCNNPALLEDNSGQLSVQTRRSFSAIMHELAAGLSTELVDSLMHAFFVETNGQAATSPTNCLRPFIDGSYRSVKQFSGFFTVSQSCHGTLFSADDTGPVMIDGETLTSAKQPSGKYMVCSRDWEAGRTYRITVQNSLKSFEIEGIDGTKVWTGSTGTSIPWDITTDTVLLLRRAYQKVLVVQKTFKLSDKELTFLQIHGFTGLLLRCGSPTPLTFSYLTQYCLVRERVKESTALDLVDFLAAAAEDVEFKTLAGMMNRLFDLPESDAETYFGMLVDRSDVKDDTQRLYQRNVFMLSPFNLERLIDAATALNGMRYLGISLGGLIDIAQPLPWNDLTRHYEDSRKLQSLISSIPGSISQTMQDAIDQARESQRDALAAYLINQPFFKDLQINDFDDLYEYLLIDVQMGASLQTSRIKQAISTVQLFVQRILLGSEARFGLKPESVSKTAWQTLERYRTWEAARKVYLWPENWLDPALRDDKSQLFQKLESSMLQTSLNSDGIFSLIRDYLAGVSRLGTLEVAAYHLETLKDAVPGMPTQSTAGANSNALPDQHQRFHIFAKTKSAPYLWYYRQVDVYGGAKDNLQRGRWFPWEQIDIDIPTYTTSSTGQALATASSYLVPIVWRGRLLLFIPEFTSRARSSEETHSPSLVKNAKDANITDFSTGPKATKYWEVKMSWTEYRHGKWTTKKTSQMALECPEYHTESEPTDPTKAWTDEAGWKAMASSSALKELADLQSFQVSISVGKPTTNTADEVLQVDLARTFNSDPNHAHDKCYRFPLGYWQLQGDTMNLSGYAKGSCKSTIPTSFSRYQRFIYSSHLMSDRPPDMVFNSDLAKDFGWEKILNKDLANPVKDVRWTLNTNGLDDGKFVSTGYAFDYLFASNKGSLGFFSYPSQSFTKPGATSPELYAGETRAMYNGAAAIMMEAAPASPDAMAIYDALRHKIPPLEQNEVFGTIIHTYQSSQPGGGEIYKKIHHELATPNSIYSWELGFHVVSLLMERLMTTQQYDLAVKTARLVFDPTATDTSKKFPEDIRKKCWKFIPFTDPSIINDGSLAGVTSSLMKDDTDLSYAIREWKAHAFNAHSVARGRPVAYMKRFVRKYIEALVASGDELFRQNSLEMIPLALQRYIEASHIYGPPMQAVNVGTGRKDTTFAAVEDALNDFSDVSTKLELLLPFKATDKDGLPLAGGTPGFVPSSYFGIPPNPELTALRSLIDDRLYKIRHGLDINGNRLRLALFDPPMDVGALVRSAALNGGQSLLQQDSNISLPNYRFYYLLQKAFELCAEVKQLGAAFLATKEKLDNEKLSMIRSRQENTISKMLMDMKLAQITEAEKSVEALKESRNSIAARMSYFIQLSGDKNMTVPKEGETFQEIDLHIEPTFDDELHMNSNEKLEFERLDDAAEHMMGASGLNVFATALFAIPTFTIEGQPFGVGGSTSFGGSNIAQAVLTAAEVLRVLGQTAQDDAAKASRKNNLKRQLQERRSQVNAAGFELNAMNKQIEVAKARIAICQADIEAQKKATENGLEIEAYLTSKYTSEQLYMFMEGAIRNLHHETYLLANQIALKAEKSFAWERQQSTTAYISEGSFWNPARDGLLAGEHLYLNLKRLEAAYHEQRGHQYEVTRHISLRQINPWALLELREKGSTTFSIPETFFDLDYPGHYSRRIKTVALSIPCIVGPYSSLSCTLSLNSSRFRASPVAASAEDYQEKGDKNILNDPRFKYDVVPISSSSIAVSHGRDDSGLFAGPTYNDERYLPFEGAGAISTWTLSLPPKFRSFDYRTISDAVLTMRYTSLSDGRLAEFATGAVEKELAKVSSVSQAGEQGLYALFELRYDFPDNWFAFAAQGKMAGRTEKRTFTVPPLKGRLPYWARVQTVKASAMAVLAGKDAVSAVKTVDGKVDFKVPTVNGEMDQFSFGVEQGTESVDLDVEMEIEITLKSKDVMPERMIMVVRYSVGDAT